jgi:hypothetical protein
MEVAFARIGVDGPRMNAFLHVLSATIAVGLGSKAQRVFSELLDSAMLFRRYCIRI